MENLKKFQKQKEDEIKILSEQIESVMNQLAGYPDSVYENNGIEAFGQLDYPEYYGVASISVPDPSGDSSAYYYFPEGMSEDYEGWISSSETC